MCLFTKQHSTYLNRGLSAGAAALATAASDHWRRWAAKRSRAAKGKCARDAVEGFCDEPLATALAAQPDVW